MSCLVFYNFSFNDHDLHMIFLIALDRKSLTQGFLQNAYFIFDFDLCMEASLSYILSCAYFVQHLEILFAQDLIH